MKKFINRFKELVTLENEYQNLEFMLYSGKIEDIKLNEYLLTLPQKQYDIVSYKFINQINNPPYVIVIERK